jgi:protein-S-isoprenylcysteine O-methyltransferase Ste14
MGRGLATAFFAVLAAAFVDDAVEACISLVQDPALRAGALAAYAVLRAGVLVAFAVFVFLRGPARRPSREPVAFAACLVGMFGLVAIQKPDASVETGLVLVGDVVVLVSVAWMLVSVLALGRCFGVLPEARGLVTRGPYRLVRHPLYLGEFGTCAGFVIAAPSGRNVAVALVFAAAQGTRMILEERALALEFPEYAAYRQRTPRLLPRVEAVVEVARRTA